MKTDSKNDQAWVEQKNGAIVRRLVGYQRLEGLAAAEALTRLYAASRLFVNFFQPSFKRLLTTRSARPEPFASTVQRRIKSPTGFQAPPAGAMSGARPAPSARQLAAVALQYSPPPAPT